MSDQLQPTVLIRSVPKTLKPVSLTRLHPCPMHPCQLKRIEPLSIRLYACAGKDAVTCVKMVHDFGISRQASHAARPPRGSITHFFGRMYFGRPKRVSLGLADYLHEGFP
jgi:hypothetical protein